MAIRPIDEYTGKVDSPTADYPDGKARNISSPGDGTGTPWEAKLVNDIFGFQQFLTANAGITPSGTPESATTSQYFEAIWKLLNIRTLTYNIVSDVDLTLTATQNLYRKIIVTDSGVVLTTGRNVIVDNIGKIFLFTNSTAQVLTVKTASGTGIAIPAGGSSILVNDGTNVTLLTTATPTSDYELVNKKYVDNIAGKITLIPAVNVAGMTAYDIPIPSWAKSIDFDLSGLSGNGASNLLFQLVVGGVAATTGYSGSSTINGASSVSSIQFSGSGFEIAWGGTTAKAWQGTISFNNRDGAGLNWNASGVIGRSDAANTAIIGGTKGGLSGALTAIRITHLNGTDQFDAGSVSAIIKG